MSDHVDGPRTAADPSIDLTDLFAFTSPADPTRTVLIADVFPFAGETALFSNAVNYSIVLRPVRVAGLGDAAAFKAQDPEIRFLFQFEVLKRGPDGQRQAQTGLCTLPDGRTLALTVNQEQGSQTPDGTVRVFAGLRSDPFFIGWRPDRELKAVANLLQEDNVLSLVVEVDTARVLGAGPGRGTLFGVIAETTPRDPRPYVVTPPRYDWVGRPEQTNFRFNVVPNLPDIRDLWNQEVPFAVSPAHLPLYRERLLRSLQRWDAHDGRVDWPPAALAASVNVFLDDFLLIDVARPTTDASHLEIEKSTLDGRPYTTGGGRTVNANVIDILVTWLVNHDHGPFMQSATQATQPGAATFPYVRPPNQGLLTISTTVHLAAAPQPVWDVVGDFGGPGFPLVARVQTSGEGIGQLRRLDTLDGRVIVERLTGLDPAQRRLNYQLVSGLPASPYDGTLQVSPNGSGCRVTWAVHYRPEGVADGVAHAIIAGLQRANLAELTRRFGAAP